VKLIAGLGNPGPRYAGSRHNVGYAVADELARRWTADLSRHATRFEGLLGEAAVGGERVYLLKPTTFMNLSGRSVAAVTRFYRLAPADVLVVFDDLDLPPGRVRLRAGGSAGGPRGMEDVIRHLGTDQVARVRIGIGRVHRAATVDYVLSSFAPEEREPITRAVAEAASAAEAWVRRGITAAMNEFNRRGSEPTPPGDAAGPAAEGERV